ncbi:MAG: pyruvate kinase [Acidobacteria bacterium]|nr:pyruvate kinase [Acidobacteriota bacterium]MSO63230.1 pyruvate kinase [Acidobacteriota bacterium]
MFVRHTKIIATIGPASSEPRLLDELIAAGVDIVRLNFSHGTQADHAEKFHMIREAAKRAKRHVAILQDLSGPKIRIGRLDGGRPIMLDRGAPLVVAIGDAIGGPGRVFTNYAELALRVAKGDHLLIDDGKIELVVESASPGEIHTRVIDGGELGEHKGINAPHVPLRSEMTEKDRRDLAFGLALGVDMVALSFVQAAADITRARTAMVEAGRPKVPIIAKLERPEAIDHLDEILDASDAVMVARGDLGLEIPLERVPRVQKEILRKAQARSVPAIVATQVLESMRTEPRPTRAEASDAAGAVDGGADAIMLSGETATGRYPVRSVEVLDAIIRDAESMTQPGIARADDLPNVDHTRALSEAAVTLARRSGAHAIVAVTREGQTARLLSTARPQAIILAATDNEEVARRLNLWRGVVPMVCDLHGDIEEVITRVVDGAVKRSSAPENATLVFVNTATDLDRGGSNFVRIRRV